MPSIVFQTISKIKIKLILIIFFILNVFLLILLIFSIMKSKVEPGNEIGMCQGRFPYGARHKKAAPKDGLPCPVKRSYLLTKSSCSSRAWPSVPQSTPQPRTASTRPGSGPAATALGIGLPSPAARCVEVSTSRASSAPSCR